MFYTNRNLGFRIRNVFQICRPPAVTASPGRAFSALALRLRSKTTFLCGGETLEANDFSLVYIPSGVPYDRRTEAEEELIILHLIPFGEEERCIQVLDLSRLEHIQKRMLEILEQWEQRRPGYEHRYTALLHTLFEQLELSGESAGSTPEERILKNGIAYLKMHFDDPALSVSRLAGECSISEVYFRRLYKQCFGISPAKAIRKMKIEYACELLDSGFFNVGEAAEKAGFGNPKHFSTVFKQETGMTPREYWRRSV